MQTMQNAVTLGGHLGAAIEVKQLSTGKRVAHVSLATTEYFKNKEGTYEPKTEWHHLVAWDNVAEKMQRDLAKGMFVIVHGKLVNRRYLDKKGTTQTLGEIVVREFSKLVTVNTSSQQSAA